MTSPRLFSPARLYLRVLRKLRYISRDAPCVNPPSFIMCRIHCRLGLRIEISSEMNTPQQALFTSVRPVDGAPKTRCHATDDYEVNSYETLLPRPTTNEFLSFEITGHLSLKLTFTSTCPVCVVLYAWEYLTFGSYVAIIKCDYVTTSHVTTKRRLNPDHFLIVHHTFYCDVNRRYSCE